jgi:hypothetical protein
MMCACGSIFEARLGLSWRSHGMSITLGMGVYSACNLGISFMHDRKT